MSGWRLAQGGSLIDRSSPIAFRWGRRECTGLSGDTLASALIANGIGLVGRSFKYHRPRGLLGAGLEEPNTIVQWGEGGRSTPNLKATTIELYEGLIASAVNAFPSPERDLLAINGWFKRFIPAAFYYKTFTWPDWHWFEPVIRRAAGLGRVHAGPDPDHYAHAVREADCLVIGGGLAGLEAAARLTAEGRHVLLVEADPQWGGAIHGPDCANVRARANRLVAALGADPRVELMPRTTVLALQDHGFVTMLERLTDHLPPAARSGPRQCLWTLRPRQIVIATGAHERPLVFAGNDVPGVMLASAAAILLERHAVAPGRRLVLAANNDRAWDSALAFAAAGVEIAAILEARPEADPARVRAARDHGIEVQFGMVPWKVHGRQRVCAIAVGQLSPDGSARPTGEVLACDAVLMSGGFSPAVQLHGQAGGALRWDARAQAFVPEVHATGWQITGAAAGEGLGAAEPVWHVAADPLRPSGDAFVDFQNDVTAADIALAQREAFQAVEHLKRYTTLGMASDQGKTSNVNGLAIMASLMRIAPDAVGTTRFRPPYEPAAIGAFAGHRTGDLLKPRRHLPARKAHETLGAAFEEYGLWHRPACYPRPGESEAAAVWREAAAVRAGVGLFDASPLGKIEVKGPDAARFLDRMYVGRVSTLKPGACRYGLMLNEHGIVFDDGIVARLSDDHFLVGTTSSNAGAVYQRFEEWLQCEWPDLRVAFADVTQGWAVMNVAGPQSRMVLAELDGDIDLPPEAFPHLSHREGHLDGVPCRIQRVSFSGELSYEVAVPSRFAASLHDRLMTAGQRFGITPFGIEALMVLRAEKGFLHLGSETDGTTFPDDIGFGAPVRVRKDDFVGRRSCLLPEAAKPRRRQLVGLESLGGELLAVGAHIVSDDSRRESEGWVTTSVLSPALGRPHALAMVRDGRARLGEKVAVWHLGQQMQALIVAPCAFDPGGERMNA